MVIAVLVLVTLGGGLFWLFGHQVADQLTGLRETLPRAWEQTRTWLEGSAAGRFVVEQISAAGDSSRWVEFARKFAAVSATTLGHALLILFAGMYVAATPSLYLDGFVRLFPVRHRGKLHDALIDSGEALRKWLLGQIVSMVSVGMLTGVGLWIVGAPLPVALALLAGLLEFIPIVGPILAMIPGILVAFTEGPRIALYAVFVYVAVQQIEGNVIMPLAQKWAVRLPAALGLFALAAFGTLFGFLGVLFGVPLAIVAMRIVQRLYIGRGLEKTAGGPPPGRET